MTDFNLKPKFDREGYGWTRRKLRHFDGAEGSQFVTFRLYDSLPSEVLERWRAEAANNAAFRKRVERFLDTGYGECWLRLERVAKIVSDAFKYHDQQRYDLRSWVIMPNHSHILFQQYPGEHLPDILHSIKSYTAQEANRFLGRKGQFWQHEYFDRYIRGPRHFAAVVRYVENNPVKAGLCGSPGEWRFSSAFERNDLNGG